MTRPNFLRSINRTSRDDDDIVGIAPAYGVWAVYSDPDGATDRCRVHLWALLHDGLSIEPVEVDERGNWEFCRFSDNFVRLEFDGPQIEALT